MRFVKLFLISVIVLFLILTAFSLLLPSKVRISRAVNITALKGDAMEEIKNLKQWQQWNEYTKALPLTDTSPKRISSAILSVDLQEVDSSSVHTSWQQKNKSAFPGVFNVIAQGSQITVQWYFVFSVKWYPWEKFGSIIYDKELGPVMEKSLQNLKQKLEKAP